MSLLTIVSIILYPVLKSLLNYSSIFICRDLIKWIDLLHMFLLIDQGQVTMR